MLKNTFSRVILYILSEKQLNSFKIDFSPCLNYSFFLCVSFRLLVCNAIKKVYFLRFYWRQTAYSVSENVPFQSISNIQLIMNKRLIVSKGFVIFYHFLSIIRNSLLLFLPFISMTCELYNLLSFIHPYFWASLLLVFALIFRNRITQSVSRQF